MRGCATAVQPAHCFFFLCAGSNFCWNFSRAQLPQLQRCEGQFSTAGDKRYHKCVRQATDRLLLNVVRWEEKCKSFASKAPSQFISITMTPSAMKTKQHVRISLYHAHIK